ncbi:MarR family winged helix-turn-helix transcriptional regulator [Streptomyces sp. NPDC014676]|uniref:MarR family winged helix-turn-helix transcriptional regulator n=1 Tax=Streptomyces sp. NPDC014676 TaxID=3364879 RepID=UPI0036FF136B
MDSAPEPRWLNAEEQQTWLAVVYLLARLPSALDAQTQRDSGISLFEYQVLSGLSMTPGHSLRMSDLAEYTSSSLSRLSNVASRLERRGWLCRTADPSDGRFTRAVLTEAGLEKVVAAAPGHVEEVRRLLFDPLTKAQQGRLNQICRRVLRAIDPEEQRVDDPFKAIGRAAAAQQPE